MNTLTDGAGLKQSQGFPSWSGTQVQHIVTLLDIQSETRQHRCSIHQVVTQQTLSVRPWGVEGNLSKNIHLEEHRPNMFTDKLTLQA